MILKRLITFMTLVTLVMTFISCSEEIYERETHSTQRKTKDVITFKQFKEQTGIKDFMSLRSFSMTGENNRSVEEDYLIDTLTVMYFASPTGKDTYTFKIYPITEDLNPKEYYNLVYEKNGSIWNEIIFKNKEKDNPQPGESKLEFSEMIYNRQHSSLSFAQFCEVITITNANCNCLNRNNCDWCEQCIRVQVTYEYCPSSGSGSSGSGGIIVGPGDSGGGGTFNGIYIPNPYEPGEEDLNNPDFVLSMNVAAWTRGLPANVKNIIGTTNWLYPNIVFYMKNNGGLTQENKDKVLAALSKFPAVLAHPQPLSTFEQIQQFQYWAFNYFLNNPDVSLEQFKNWFMTPNEGKDFLYDPSYWENPNLNIQQQNLPSYNDYLNGMPRFANGQFMTGANNVYSLVGGQVQQIRNQYPQQTENTCALKVSIALNRANIIIPNIPGQTVEGGGLEFSGKYFFLNAKALNSWMRETFGTNPATTSTSLNSNHISYTGADGGTNGENFPPLFNGIKGIFSIITTDVYDNNGGASGHADLLFPNSTNGDGTCIFGCNFNLPVERVDVWILQ